MPASREDLWSFHTAPQAFARLTPPWENVVMEQDPGRIEDGLEPVLVIRKGPIKQRWVARYRDVKPGFEFTDEQVSGPFSEWVHRHHMVGDDGATTSRLVDRIRYRLPLGPVGALFGGPMVRAQLRSMFAWRHRVTSEDLADSRRLGQGSGRVLVTGASGLVGRALCAHLGTSGYEVVRAVRRATEAPDEIQWDPAQGMVEPARLEGLAAVVHLAGENIAGGRWTAERKERLESSRVPPTRRLAEQLAALDTPPPVALFASAIGFYGAEPRGPVDETSEAGEGYLADMCRRWEEAADPARDAGIRVVHPRIGIVLSPAGGALAKMLPPFRFGVGGPLGNGRQPMSWISIEDLIRVLRQAIADDRMVGPVNCVAPDPVDNAGFSRMLGRVLRRPAFLPAPAFALRLAFGRDMADQVLLGGVDVRSRTLKELNFPWVAPTLEPALRRVLGRTREVPSEA